jgi:cob(I)alamin adenosyltransferase
MKIYTGRGDEGKTDLWASDERVSKTDPRIEAYGAVDELIGLLGHAAVHASDEIQQELETVQHQLHVLMAELADKERKGDKHVGTGRVAELEDTIDAYNDALEPVDSFVLPGGSDGGSLLHYARSVCRRAERRIVMLAEAEGVPEDAISYINRLSDLLFTLARYQNMVDGVEEHRVDYSR